MKYTSQNRETEIALNYFKDRKGTILDIGANTGYFLSNSYDLIQQDWACIAVEPSIVFNDLIELHKGNKKVSCYNVAIAEKEGKLKFFESGAHIKGGTDKALVSTAIPKEMERWSDVDFKEIEVDAITFSQLRKMHPKETFNYISLDVEGFEWQILKQIDLKEVGCELLCIEWNGNKELKNKFTNYCNKFGLKQIHQNAENILFAK